MLTPRLSFAIFAVSLAAIASAQLLSKWRIGAILQQIASFDSWLSTAVFVLSDAWIWLIFGCMLLGVASWYIALSQLPLSLMMPIGSVVAPCVALGAHYFLGEPLSTSQVGAIVVIALGVAWLGYLQ
jgi:drug/metabolite transporter (DMT)-like permease